MDSCVLEDKTPHNHPSSSGLPVCSRIQIGRGDQSQKVEAAVPMETAHEHRCGCRFDPVSDRPALLVYRHVVSAKKSDGRLSAGLEGLQKEGEAKGTASVSVGGFFLLIVMRHGRTVTVGYGDLDSRPLTPVVVLVVKVKHFADRGIVDEGESEKILVTDARHPNEFRCGLHGEAGMAQQPH